MKFKSLLLLALAALLTLAAPRPARALEVSFDFFYDSLSPHGEWIEVGDYGYCWRPSNVDEDWAPYSDGYWTYTDAGWTWVSYEDFGGIVYHYGRWVKLEDEGWCWVPDYEWGPAWVSWRKSDDYVGWAPLPAEAHWQRERGISVWADTSYDIGPASYSFCRYSDFGAPVLRPVLIPRRENIVIINNTVNITNISYNTNARCVFNGGLDYGYVNRFARRPIPALKLVRNTNVTVVNNHIVNNNVRVTNFNSVQRGNQLTVLAPTVVRPEPAQMSALLKPKVTKIVAQQKVSRGWGNVPTDQRAAVRAKYQQEVEGKTPETAPARPVKTADLKVVPVKADPKAKLPTVNRNLEAPLAPGAGDEKKMPEAITKVPGGRGRPPGAPAVDDDKKAPDAVTKVPVTPTVPGAMPPGGFDPSKTAREKGRKPGKIATPPPAATAETNDNPPVGKPQPETSAPVARERVQPARPGIVKPFNPQANDDAPAGNVRMAATPPPNNSAVEKRNAAAEAAKERAAAQAAARQRAMDQKEQQESVARRNNAQEAATASRQRMIQQQQLQENQQNQQEQVAARKRATDAQQMQQNQQQQALRERAAQAAETRQRSLQLQQSQAAAARQQAAERAQAAAAARQQAVEAPPVQRQRAVPPAVQQRSLPPAVQQQQQIQRNMPPPVQRNVAPVVPQQRGAVKPGKRPLTPEEAAKLQQNQ
jgi:hypothetical protein